MRRSPTGRSSACSGCDDGGGPCANSSPERGGGPCGAWWRGPTPAQPASPSNTNQAGEAGPCAAEKDELAGGFALASPAQTTGRTEIPEAIPDRRNDGRFRLPGAALDY